MVMKQIPLETQKMETLGRLTSRVVHDLNNMLTIIQLNSALMETGEVEAEESASLAGEISRACSHAATLTESVLSYIRNRKTERDVFEVGKVFRDLHPLLDLLAARRSSIKVDLPQQPLWISGVRGELDQALLNLVINAIDASPRDGIVLQARSVYPANRTGGFVEITVEDTGTGIPPEVAVHLFEPFFTTKGVGSGTGLGLDIVHRVATSNFGWVEYDTEVGRGTAFRLYFPAATVGDIPSGEVEEPGEDSGLEGTILLVEDDENIRAICRHILEKQGWTVLDAAQGEQARELWRDHREAVDLLFTDLILPGPLSGHDLAVELRREKPALKVIYCSGNSVAMAGLPERGGESFVPKPFQPETLIARVRALLGA